ncbi:MAG: 4'-phosphopantetheinyl transferase superfamily protein [Caldimonas sp.]
MLAIADEGEIGIDVELDQATADEPALVARYFSPAEVASWNALPHTERQSRFLYAWTRKEAILKALGCGLQLEPSGIDAGIELRDIDVAVAVEGRPRTVRVQTLVIDSSAIVSVARIVAVADSPTFAAIAAYT